MPVFRTSLFFPCIFFVTLQAAPCNLVQAVPEPVVQPIVQPPDTTAIEEQIASAFGIVIRNEEGVIVGVDLARERASATDEVLKAALSLPGLKRFRLAGGSITAEALAGLKNQRELTELYLQDVPVIDAEWGLILDGLTKLERLTLRRLPHLSGSELGGLPRRLPKLKNLALIEMAPAGEALAEIAKSELLAALDVRNCGQLDAADYQCLGAMKKLVDLKIGGFGVTDEVLAALIPLSGLTGLTIDDAVITPGGFDQFVTESVSADKLHTLVLSRNSALFDAALVSLKKLPKLQRLTVNGMMVTGSFLDRLAEDEAARPKLQRLSLRKAFLSEEGTAALMKYPELRILDLSGAALTPEMVEIIASLSRLEELDLTESQIEEEPLQRLQSMKTLKRLIR